LVALEEKSMYKSTHVPEVKALERLNNESTFRLFLVEKPKAGKTPSR
jgi:hypothetical protein